MTICYFGIYNPDYSRNKILISGLRQNGVKVIECRTDLRGLKKYFDLIKKHFRLKNKYDLMFVGFPGHQAMLLAKFLSRKPIIFDAFLSLYDSMVLDRADYSRYSLKAKYFWLLDYLSVRLADHVLLDTQTHIKYFVETFKLKPQKFTRIFIGADDKIFYPRQVTKKTSHYIIHFHGTYIPLQGIEYIIQAARLLRHEPIYFNLIGNIGLKSKEYKKAITLLDKYNLKNIRLKNFIPQSDLVEYIAMADICLGIFGATPKAERVIPNKLYECIAMAKPTITADTPAVREIFEDNKTLAFCERASAQSLADRILTLINNPDLMQILAKNSYDLFQKRFCPKILSKELLIVIKMFYARNN